MNSVVIDFETFYSKDISVVTLGNGNYVRSADAYIVGIQVGGEVHCGTLKELGPTCEQIGNDPTVRPVAANSNFDQVFWEKYFPKFKKPWHCLLDQSAFHQFPRNLAGLSKAALGREMDKSTRDIMKGVHYESLPDEADDSGLPTKTQVQEYCANDVVVEAECLAKLPPMSAVEEKVAAHTRLINRRGIAINTELVAEDKTKLEAMRFEAFKSIPWHADYPPLSYPAFSRYCVSKGIPVPKSLDKRDEECASLVSDNPALAEVLGQMRRFRRANAMIKKAESLMERTTEEGILTLDILYCGAPHTRRWSSKGFNVQNLDKEPLVTRVWNEKVTANSLAEVERSETVWTRNWIVPRPGHTFLILDYAQIEPRCLNWLAGNEEMLAALRQGYSIYESFAIQAEGWSGQPGTIKEQLGKKKYTLLKNRVLGLGYGMGAPKFEDYVRTNGGEISALESKQIVADFRARNAPIVKLWRKLDSLITSAARDKSRHLALELPTGDLLQHFFVRTHGKGYESFTTKGDFGQQSRQPRLWGGTLTENITQRMARDLLAQAIVNLEEAGLRVAFHVHDEVVLEIPNGSKDEAKAEAEAIMTKPPEWANDLPLGVEGDFADAYTK